MSTKKLLAPLAVAACFAAANASHAAVVTPYYTQAGWEAAAGTPVVVETLLARHCNRDCRFPSAEAVRFQAVRSPALSLFSADAWTLSSAAGVLVLRCSASRL